MNLLIIDDEQIVREGLKTIFPGPSTVLPSAVRRKTGRKG